MKKFLLIFFVVLLTFSATGCMFLERVAVEAVFNQLCHYVVVGGEEGVEGIVSLHVADVQDQARLAYTILDAFKFTKFEGQNTDIVINGDRAVLTTDILWTRTNFLGQTVSDTMVGVEYELARVDFLEWKFTSSGGESQPE